MKKKKILRYSLISLIIVLVVCVGGYFGYNYYLKFKREVTPVYHAIPGNSSMIVEVVNASGLWQELQRKSIIRQMEEFPSVADFFSQVNAVDSVLKRNESFQRWLEKKRFLLSLHFRGSEKFSVLAALQLPNTRQGKQVVDYMKEHAAVGEIGDYPFKLFKASLNDSLHFFFSVPQGMLLASFDQGLLTQALEFLDNEKHILTVPEFRKVYNYRGKNVSANIFFNHDGFHRFLAQFAGEQQVSDFGEWSSYAGWSEVDLILEDNGLWFSGHTAVNDSDRHFLNVFTQQEADKITMASILPARTAILSYYGFDDFQSFYKNYKLELDKQSERQTYLDNFMNEHNLDLPTWFFSWIDNELAKNVVRSSTGEHYQYAVIATRDKKEAMQSLNKLAQSIGYKQDVDSLSYRSFEIGRLNDPYLFRLLFGKRFRAITNPYYTLIGDYAVFSSSREALEYAINAYMLSNTLDKNERYAAFAEKIAGQANIYLYYNLQYALDFIMPMLSKEMQEFAEQNRSNLMDFPMGGFQYQYQEGKIYTNFYIKSDTASVEEISTGWEVALEAPLARAPEFVVDHYTKRKKIIAFDTRKQMYLIDLNGKIQWKIQLKELPLGSVELIDFYDNNKFQYLFSTKTMIYCIALNGKHVDGFPFETAQENTNPLVALDYKNNKDYRIMVAGKDNVIYNYLKDGRQVRGWENPRASHMVNAKIQRLVLDDKDFIIVADTAGNVDFLSRRGNERITPEPAFTNDPRTAFYEVKKEGREFMMTTDKGGRIIFIDKEGNVDKVSLNEFSANYSFAWLDMDNDGSKDFVFLDRNYLYVYDRAYKIMSKTELSAPAVPDIKYCSIAEDTAFVLLRKQGSNELFKASLSTAEDFSEPVSSQFSVLLYENPSENRKNVILSEGKLIESMPIN